MGEEGDPVELAETRGSTFGRNAKFYFPVRRRSGGVPIADLFEVSDQRYYYAVPTCEPCRSEWERLHYSRIFRLCITSAPAPTATY